MSKVLVTEDYLEDIADAIRGKLGVQTTYKPGQMAAAIGSIPTGITPTGTINITENGTVDVTQYATADVQVSGGGGGGATILSGTDLPTAAQGSNGDIYLRYKEAPDGYTLLSYLQATGIQYIDTGVAVSNLTAMEVKLSDIVAPSWAGLCGASQGNTNNANALLVNTGDGYISAQYGNVYANIAKTLAADTLYTIRLDGGKCYVNGEQIGQATYSGSFNAPVNAYLFAMSTSSGINFAASAAKVARMTLWEDGVLSGDLIPVRRNSDSALGMYDLVNQSFRANIGSGAFTAGADEADGAIQDTYLKVSGAWQPLIGSDISDVGGVTT